MLHAAAQGLWVLATGQGPHVFAFACCLTALLCCQRMSLPVAAAEVIPPFQYSKCLQGPLAPRSLTLQPQQTVTLHLHSFEVSQPSQQQQHPQGGAAALLQLAVGSPMRCKAVPGGSSSSASSAGQRNSFGVLTWEQLPGAVTGCTLPGGSTVPLEFPAWVSLGQAEPSNVSKQTACCLVKNFCQLAHLLVTFKCCGSSSVEGAKRHLVGSVACSPSPLCCAVPCAVQVRVVHHGPVTLSAPELLTLMRYQHTLHNTINWSNKVGTPCMPRLPLLPLNAWLCCLTWLCKTRCLTPGFVTAQVSDCNKSVTLQSPFCPGVFHVTAATAELRRRVSVIAPSWPPLLPLRC